jgi:hypothetical protein
MLTVYMVPKRKHKLEGEMGMGKRGIKSQFKLDPHETLKKENRIVTQPARANFGGATKPIKSYPKHTRVPARARGREIGNARKSNSSCLFFLLPIST